MSKATTCPKFTPEELDKLIKALTAVECKEIENVTPMMRFLRSGRFGMRSDKIYFASNPELHPSWIKPMLENYEPTRNKSDQSQAEEIERSNSGREWLAKIEKEHGIDPGEQIPDSHA